MHFVGVQGRAPLQGLMVTDVVGLDGQLIAYNRELCKTQSYVLHSPPSLGLTRPVCTVFGSIS
jgi:hypothetical protein